MAEKCLLEKDLFALGRKKYILSFIVAFKRKTGTPTLNKKYVLRSFTRG